MNKLNIEYIKENLKTKFIGKELIFYRTVESTNEIAKVLANNQADGLVVLAESQTKGVGRQKKAWQSPPGVGIWLSIMLRPNIDICESIKLVSLFAMAIQNALKQFTGLDILIKWPNDIVINKKKVCGILIENVIRDKSLNAVIVGMGINVNQTIEYFDNIQNATSFMIESNKTFCREDCICAVLYTIEKYYKSFLKTKKLNMIELEKTSALFGKQVKVIDSKYERIGEVIGFDENGAIIIKDNENINIVNTNATVRGLNSYID